jgi:hypothetical protein
MTPKEIQEYVDNRIDSRLGAIAELAAEKALEQVYAGIGKSVLKKLSWAVGVIILAILAWLSGKGVVKIP